MDHLDELKQRLDDLRPLTSDDLKILWPRFEAEKPNFVYSTNAIENNTLTLGETIVVLQNGVTIAGKPLKDHVEAINGAKAYDLMLDMARNQRPITRNTLLAVHAVICAAEDHAGAFRDEPNYIFGSKHVTPNWRKVSELIDQMFERYQGDLESKHPVMTGAILHFDLVTIHPFKDGNGRTARLLNNLHLIQNGYPPVLLDPAKDKPEYFKVLETGQLQGEPGIGDPTPLVGYMTGMEARALKDYLHVLEETRDIPNRPEEEHGRGGRGR